MFLLSELATKLCEFAIQHLHTRGSLYILSYKCFLIGGGMGVEISMYNKA